jgi:hypothetical protein
MTQQIKHDQPKAVVEPPVTKSNSRELRCYPLLRGRLHDTSPH